MFMSKLAFGKTKIKTRQMQHHDFCIFASPFHEIYYVKKSLARDKKTRLFIQQKCEDR